MSRRYVVRWYCIEPRFWLKWWHWRHWSFTLHRRLDWTPCGTWILVAGPLTVTRDAMPQIVNENAIRHPQDTDR